MSMCVCGGMKSGHFPKKWFGLETDNEICQENCSWIYLFSKDKIDVDTTALTLEKPRVSVENAYEIVDTNVEILKSKRMK